MEYVIEKALQNDLHRQARNWKRKVDVAQMAMKREKKILQNLLKDEKGADAMNVAAAPNDSLKGQPILFPASWGRKGEKNKNTTF